MSDQFAPPTEETTWQPQVTSPAPETQGYQGPGGTLRLSIRDRIAAIAPYSKEIVTVEEWGGVQIEVRSLSLGARNDMLARAAESEGGDADLRVIYPEMVLLCCYDPATGERVFADDDLEFINSRPANIVDKLAHPAMRLSGMSESAVDEASKASSETETSVSVSSSLSEQDAP